MHRKNGVGRSWKLNPSKTRETYQQYTNAREPFAKGKTPSIFSINHTSNHLTHFNTEQHKISQNVSFRQARATNVI